jgi:hypothetical protein
MMIVKTKIYMSPSIRKDPPITKAAYSMFSGGYFSQK